MELFAIILLLLVGLVFLFAEFFIIPGLTVFGIIGFAMIIGGVVMSYYNYGNEGMLWAVGASAGGLVLQTVLGFKANLWKKTAHNTAIETRVEKIQENTVKIGDTGVCISRLAPMGKIMVNNQYIEASAPNQYIEAGTEIEVTKVLENHVLVRAKN